jgi:CBS domain-containing protein
MKTVDDVMKTIRRTLWSIAPDFTISRAIKFMDDNQAEALPVLDAGTLVGVISEKHCIKNVILSGKSLEETQVWEIMERNFIFTSPGQFIEDCLDVMTENHVRHLPVIADGALVAFLSMNDVFSSILIDQKDYITRLENYVMGIGFI